MNNTKEKIDNLISQSKKVLITAHMGPDDDAVASILSMNLYIQKYHPNVSSKVALSGEKMSKWDFLPNSKDINWVEDIVDLLDDIDLLILQDGTPLKRFTEKEDEIDLSKIKTLCIDHHVYEDEDYTFTLRDTIASSNTQILAETLFSDEDLQDKNLGEILLVGIYGDTGNMTFISPKNSKTYSVAKRIVDKANIEVQILLNKKGAMSLIEMGLLSELMQNLKSIDLGKNLPKLLHSHFSESTAEKHDRQTLSGVKRKFSFMILRKVAEHPWGFTATPQEEEFSISFRSAPGAPNVQKIASERFTGGGHVFASGGQLPKKEGETIEDFMKRVIEILKEENIELTPAD